MIDEICIDPGHGGVDSGGGSNNQFKEKDMVLKISLEQKRHFERNGIQVFMTRSKDEYLPSVPRTNRVKASGANYCISNHINAGGSNATPGAEVIYSIFASSSIATGVLNALVAQGANRRRAFNRKSEQGNWDFYYMHRMTGSVNTVIIEYGFATNAGDTEKILKDWKRYAEAVAKYYIEYVFKKKYIPEKLRTSPPVEKEEPKLHKPSSATLRNSVINYLRNATTDGILSSDRWVKQAEQGTLLESDLAALRIEIEERRKTTK